MVSFEALRERRADSTLTSVPTALERTGDFSQTRTTTGAPIIIYDPFTTRANPSGSGFIRDPFVGQQDSHEPVRSRGGQHRQVLSAAEHHAHRPEQQPEQLRAAAAPSRST